jgi:GDP-L-fucose synthase
MYGPNDNFDLNSSHVLPAMIRKFHEAKMTSQPIVKLWGTGKPYREFLYVDDLADACCFLMSNYNYADIGEIINIGVGRDSTINELAELIRGVVGYQGGIEYDPSMPDGTPRKLLDISRVTALGWTAKTELRDGIAKTYQWFLQHAESVA